MRTVVIGDKVEGKQTYVLVHGYAGSGALLYKIFKGLSEHFKVVVVDIIGMGSSSRPKDFNYNEMTP